MTYKEYKKERQETFNSIINDYGFFAFNDEQFKRGLTKLGLEDTPKDRDRLFKLRGLDTYLIDEARPLIINHREKYNSMFEELKKDDDFLLSAFISELNNHEYSYTGDTEEALEVLGFTLDQVKKDKSLNALLEQAKAKIRDFEF